MGKSRIIINLIAGIVCFILFAAGMLYADQIALLTLVGIIGLTGYLYFIYKIIFNSYH